MSIKNTLQNISDEVKIIVDSSFNVQVIDTRTVPATNDNGLTYTNFDKKEKKTKSLESCVLFIDIRKSTKISLQHHPKTLTKLYSAFIRSMIKSSEYFGGKVRNIVGDRIMVLFDSLDCVKNAVDTAVLLNTVSTRIINKHFKKNDIKCGIGIDYGKMLVVKTGTIKQGLSNQDYKSLVWLGKPANIASKVTDIAHKEFNNKTFKLKYKGYNFSSLFGLNSIGLFPGKKPIPTPLFITREVTIDEKSFLKDISWNDGSNQLKFKLGDIEKLEILDEKFLSQPILITDNVYLKLKEKYPTRNSIKKGFWKKQKDGLLEEYNKDIWGSNLIFPVINEIS